jgi:hypothetical protein
MPTWKTNEPQKPISRLVAAASTLFSVQKDILKKIKRGRRRKRGE